MDLNKINSKDLNEIHKELEELIGMEDTFKIYEYFKGSTISFPKKILQ